MFTQKESNLFQRRWLELLKDFDISVFYHPGKANVVPDALCRTNMDSVSHVDESKKDLVKDVNRLAMLGVRSEDYLEVGFMVRNNSKSLLVVEVQSKQRLYKSLMEFKELVLGKLNDTFSLQGIVF